MAAPNGTGVIVDLRMNRAVETSVQNLGTDDLYKLQDPVYADDVIVSSSILDTLVEPLGILSDCLSASHATQCQNGAGRR